MLPEPTPKQRLRVLCARQLKSLDCPCGRKKQSGRSFCYKCYLKLPDNMRRDMFNPIGRGYEAAYDTACKYLYQTPALESLKSTDAVLNG